MSHPPRRRCSAFAARMPALDGLTPIGRLRRLAVAGASAVAGGSEADGAWRSWAARREPARPIPLAVDARHSLRECAALDGLTPIGRLRRLAVAGASAIVGGSAADGGFGVRGPHDVSRLGPSPSPSMLGIRCANALRSTGSPQSGAFGAWRSSTPPGRRHRSGSVGAAAGMGRRT